MACLNKSLSADIKNLIAGKNFKSRYFDGYQPDGLYGLDLFLNYYQNNVNAGANYDFSSTANFVRNPNCWAYDIDLTCCSPWNMHPTLRLEDGALPSSSNHMAGTLISPRHVIFCKHLGFYPPAGSLMRFVTKDNQTITRTMTAVSEVSDCDFAVGILDSDVPSTITFARILPDNWRNYFTTDVDGRPAPNVYVLFVNQDESVCARRWSITPDPSEVMWSVATELPRELSFYDSPRTIRILDSGSPVLLIVNKTPVLLATAFTASYGPSPLWFKTQINAVMAALGGGYSLTPIDLENYKPEIAQINGVGVNQPQSGVDYPFVAPSDDIRYLVADLHLSLDDPGNYSVAQKFKPPFAIKYLYGIGTFENTPGAFLTPAHDADIVVKDSTGATVFDSTTGSPVFSKKVWSDSHVIYNWKTSAGVCNLLAHSSCGEIGLEGKFYDKYLTPQNAVLDARAVYVLPKRLKSLRVQIGETESHEPVYGSSFAGRISFKNGYNTEITTDAPTTSNFVVDTRVTISANPNSGLGKYPCDPCDPESPQPQQPIKKINGVGTSVGDFLLSAADCLYARRPTVKTSNDVYPDNPLTAGHIALGADCQPCCKCPDYVDLALKINQYQSQYANIGRRVTNVKDVHEQNIQRWIDERNCGLNHPLRLLLVPQRCPYMDIVLMICNPCQECIFSKELTLELTPTIAATAEVVSGYTAMFSSTSKGRPVVISRSLDGDKTIFTVPFSTVKTSDSAYVRFRVKFSVKTEYAIAAKLTGKLEDDTPILAGCSNSETTRVAAEATATNALYCDANGNTNLP